MLLKQKIALIAIALFILICLFIGFVLVVSSDISEKELGELPFKIDKSITQENNPELKKIVEIGNLIQGEKEFEEKFSLDWKNPQDSKIALQSYLQLNQNVIEKIDIELFKLCKFPKPELEGYLYLVSLKQVSKLKYYQSLFYILSQDFENAYKNLGQLNQINSELMNKPNGNLSLSVVLTNSSLELSAIKELINQEFYTDEQKLKVLNLKQNIFTSQTLKNVSYFEEEWLKSELKKVTVAKTKTKEILLKSYVFQPNKSIQMYREYNATAITAFDNQKVVSFEKLNEVNFKKHFSVFVSNYEGKFLVAMVVGIIQVLQEKMLIHNNYCLQLDLAKEILTYKLNTGNLPSQLSDLTLDKKLITNIMSQKPFLYSKDNFVLQSFRRNERDDNIDLTAKKYSSEEMQEMINGGGNIRNDFIIYLK